MIRRTRLSFFVLAAALGGCGGEEINSTWRTAAINIDGMANDWSQIEFQEADGVEFAIVNDATHLYACLIPTKDSVRNQIILQGLTVWFDAAGDKDKTLGIRFPLGLTDSKDTMTAMRQLRESGQADRQEFLDAFKESLTELEIRGPEQVARRWPLVGTHGVEVMVGMSFNNSLIYEIKVPLAATDAAALSIGSSLGNTVGIGLDSPEFDRQAVMQQIQGPGSGGRGDRSGGGGGRGGGRGGGKGGMGGGPRGGPGLETPEPIDAWGKVRLSRGA